MVENSSQRATQDPRFAKVHSDPKFKNTRTKDFKIKLDDRFSKKDLEIKRKAKVDKYGRKLKSSGNKDVEDFDKYFAKDSAEDSLNNSDPEGNDGEEELEEEAAVKRASVDRARGEIPVDYESSSEEESSSESEEDSEDSELESEEELEAEKPKVESGDSSKTLAVVNLDWDHVKSTDLMVTFSSFVPKGGDIKKIAIYPSEFGKERMQREEVEGPPREIFKTHKKKKNTKGSNEAIRDLYEEGDAEEDFDSRSLRRYQLDRLRYYYAVVYCNNTKTAEAIYQNCDGTEYESTANMFDLRYVPDGMLFEDKPRDECSSIPKNYKPSEFSTDALQHSKVKLTWDETSPDRVEISKRAFSQKELDEMDFKAYLASDSEDSEPDVDTSLKNKLKSLVSDSVMVANKSLFDQNNEEEEEVDMEITFTPGLNNEETQAQTESKEESTIEKIQRKEKERRKKRKERVKELKKQAVEEKSKSKSTSLTPEDEERKKAELELLMLDDGSNSKSSVNSSAHFNMNEILRSEKEKSKKSKYQKKERIVKDEFKPDLNDPRFQEVFEDHDFAIDPTQPEFKSTSAMKEILKERSKRSTKAPNKKRNHAHIEKKDLSSEGNLNNLVQKLKRKSKKSKY